MFLFRGHFRINFLTILRPFSHTFQAQERSYFPEFLCSSTKKTMSHLFRLGLWGVCFLAVSVPGDAALNTTGKICQWGCWDEEDEACHAGLNAAWMSFGPSFGPSICVSLTPKSRANPGMMGIVRITIRRRRRRKLILAQWIIIYNSSRINGWKTSGIQQVEECEWTVWTKSLDGHTTLNGQKRWFFSHFQMGNAYVERVEFPNMDRDEATACLKNQFWGSVRSFTSTKLYYRNYQTVLYSNYNLGTYNFSSLYIYVHNNKIAMIMTIIVMITIIMIDNDNHANSLTYEILINHYQSL